ncbi:50S ribosomal protein L25/general stress protein Ctc [Larsenimonas salina]|uniref:50S ribosomal protein L25/general stress protein Ctc n=1 Tax=Larsenimonas salina TaxID=1295565 RepID=UPI0020741976|nr:50S ribosomal protein L25/general stress protein Ctc [Larsenimonas salina]MCM5703072.1 50S ribosomal protein L25/general stress protein Ctc [Larsenimonas salina]
MSNQFTLQAQDRSDLGKGASRRLRRQGDVVPAIIYGGEAAPKPVAIDKPSFYKAIESESFFSSVVVLDIAGQKESVVIRDLQRHPYKPLITHADFMRVDNTHELTTTVPLHFANDEACKGVKDEGGVLHVLNNDVEISCLPKNLPEYLEVDVAGLGLGETLHLSDIPLPEGVTLVALSHGEESDYGIVSITHADKGTEGEGEGDDAESTTTED